MKKLILILLSLAVVSCGNKTETKSDAGDGKLKVVATTMMVADMVRAVGGDRTEVSGLMGPGVDPHLYKPVASDMSKLRAADIVFYNGLLLEGKMSELFSKMSEGERRAYAVSDAIDHSRLIAPEEEGAHSDPHVWGDVAMWAECVDIVVGGLSAAKPEHADFFAANGKAYEEKLKTLDAWAKEAVKAVPEDQRVVITSHDAFNYLGRAYGFTVVAVQGISTVTEAGLGDITKTVDFIKTHKVKAIFVESSVNQATIKRISDDAGVSIGGELFSDAMGTPGTMHEVDGDSYDEGTFEGMVKHNIYTIVDALK
jgi:manganese/zinc/iron transport system substrate-binding protein